MRASTHVHTYTHKHTHTHTQTHTHTHTYLTLAEEEHLIEAAEDGRAGLMNRHHNGAALREKEEGSQKNKKTPLHRGTASKLPFVSMRK